MVVDDHELGRNGISSMLSATDDLHLVGEAETAADAIRTAERERPDVMVMDIRLLEGSGIEATQELRSDRAQTELRSDRAQTDVGDDLERDPTSNDRRAVEPSSQHEVR